MSQGEMMVERWGWNLFQLILLSHLSSTFSSSSLPSHGCYWTESCQNRWWGECGIGHLIFNQSSDCNGQCPEPKYSRCLPYYTHFYCCIPESPKVMADGCTECNYKVDSGDQYLCCKDCSDPHIIYEDPKLGYCKTGAELVVQPKPKEVFKWVVGPWMPCSSPCDGGIRYRNVECFAVVEDTSIPDYPVYDHKCSTEEMPSRQDRCNLSSCVELSNVGSQRRKHHRLPTWLVTLLVLLGIAAVGGIAFVGYTLYKRRTSTQNGFVYIMLEGYS
uniref:Putative papilin-like isoform X1 n=1 Tax=Davidia involucrata TaxID=16924 RepID=A0A5B7BZQ9_DAVIN